MTRKRNNAFCFVLCLTLNFSATIVATSYLYSMHWLWICPQLAVTRMASPCALTWSIQTIDVVLRAGNGIHRLTIADESYNSHDKEKEQCLSLCIVLNLGISKLPSLPL